IAAFFATVMFTSFSKLGRVSCQMTVYTKFLTPSWQPPTPDAATTQGGTITGAGCVTTTGGVALTTVGTLVASVIDVPAILPLLPLFAPEFAPMVLTEWLLESTVEVTFAAGTCTYLYPSTPASLMVLATLFATLPNE
ncbi:MAG: hypothetical protein NUV75_03215, partial [Gallionella sp.]|nr:hypothetical protein [Gallionella sp.]